MSLLYPLTIDEQFAQKLVLQPQYAQYKYPKISIKEAQDIISDKIQKNDKQFTLSLNQQFLQNFFNTQTPYNSIFLTHQMGVGKSCSAISMTLTNFPTMRKIVIASKNIRENFYKELFDLSKLEYDNNGFLITTDVTNQCTQNHYLNKISNRYNITKKVLETKIKKLIQNDYTFFTYKDFEKMINNVIVLHTQGLTTAEEKEMKIKEHIIKDFSNIIFIVDEAHNLKSSMKQPLDPQQPEGQNKTLPLLTTQTLFKCLKYGENTKLILMTATPIYNNPLEIENLLNLMLVNDKRHLINLKPHINYQNLTMDDEALKIIEKASNGFVSFMRPNPFEFPVRLYPKWNKKTIHQFPAISIKDEDIPKEKQIENLQIIASVSSQQHQTIIQSFLQKIDIDSLNDIADEIEDILIDVSASKRIAYVDYEQSYSDDKERKMKSQNISLLAFMQIQNIFYPNKSFTFTTTLPKDININNFTGKKGFFNVFNRISPVNQNLRVSYKDKTNKMLEYTNIELYSSKMKTILDEVLKSEGIVFIYSYYIYQGLLPLAIALEHLGYNRYKTDNILDRGDIDTKKFSNSALQKSYTLLTSDYTLKTPNVNLISELKKHSNKDGKEIKIILANQVVAEGVDFRNIRQIHILDPHFNLSRTEQIIGRGIRKMSHMNLPPEQRNCTIYLHANVFKDGTKSTPQGMIVQKETYDLYTYRISYERQKLFSRIEKTLKENAIDCLLNQNMNSFTEKDYKQLKQTQIASDKTVLKAYPLYDLPHTKQCDYQKDCCIVCKNSLKTINNTIHRINYINFLQQDIQKCAKHIINIFQNLDSNYLTYQQIQTILKSYDPFILSLTLEYLIKEKKVFKINDIRYYLIYKKDLYLIQPIETDNMFLTKEERNYAEMINDVQYAKTQIILNNYNNETHQNIIPHYVIDQNINVILETIQNDIHYHSKILQSLFQEQNDYLLQKAITINFYQQLQQQQYIRIFHMIMIKKQTPPSHFKHTYELLKEVIESHVYTHEKDLYFLTKEYVIKYEKGSNVYQIIKYYIFKQDYKNIFIPIQNTYTITPLNKNHFKFVCYYAWEQFKNSYSNRIIDITKNKFKGVVCELYQKLSQKYFERLTGKKLKKIYNRREFCQIVYIYMALQQLKDRKHIYILPNYYDNIVLNAQY